MKVWLVLEHYSDGYTYCADVVYSVHMSEEGAFLESEELIRLQALPYHERDSERGVGSGIVGFEVKP